MPNEQGFDVGLLVFPMLTQLDLTGPYEVLNRMPGAQVHLIAKSLDPIPSEHGLPITPTTTFSSCPALDLLVIPGGPGVNQLLIDQGTLTFVRNSAEHARYLGAVCTGSLVLGAAGLLRGKRATCHWMSVAFLEAFGAIPALDRVVIDGKIITGGGVTAGIDFALAVVAQVAGRSVAEEIQLAIEYSPAPPFNAGSPTTADPDLVKTLQSKWAARQDERRKLVAQAAASLLSNSR
jgi:cyclohexyl-isocyanide hydratase